MRQRERALRRETGRAGRRATRIAAGTGAALGAGVLFAPAAQADTFTVTKVADTDDTVCDSDCSLREAIDEANSTGDDDVITFVSGLSGEIALDPSYGNLLIQDGVQIQGPGADMISVSGQDSEQVFKLLGFAAPGEQVVISGLTITEGTATDGGAVFSRGLFIQGYFYAYPADLTIANSVVTGNYASENGGAIYNAPTVGLFGGSYYSGGLTIQSSVVSDNEANGYGGGIRSVRNERPLTIADTVVTENRAEYAAGISLLGTFDTATITRATISGNEALGEPSGGGYAAGVALYGNDAPVTVEGSTISANIADGRAGGLQVFRPNGTVTVQNTTVSGNVADYDASERGAGGGIYVYNDADTEATIRNSTIAGNTAVQGGGVAGDAASAEDIVADLRSTIVADNSAPTGPDIGEGQFFDYGAFQLGFSLVESTSDSPFTESPAGSNILGLDPQLEPLAFNGGSTQTRALKPISPALDQGTSNGLAQDQRGRARTQDLSAIPSFTGGDGTDIGAFEAQAGRCGNANVNQIEGTPQSDVLNGSEGPDLITAGAGNDTANGAGGDDCVVGGDGDDFADGGTGNDEVSGDAGKDRLAGSAGKDRLRGQAGGDKLKGGGGKDRLAGQGGKDKLNGGGGKDKLKGGGGKDRINTGGGKDKVNCGRGEDKVTADPKDQVSQSCEKVVERG